MNQNNNISQTFTTGLFNFIDSIHDRLELLNGRLLLISTLGNYDLNITKDEIINLSRMRNRLIEISSREEMICFLNSIPNNHLDNKLKRALIKELIKNEPFY